MSELVVLLEVLELPEVLTLLNPPLLLQDVVLVVVITYGSIYDCYY